MISIRFSEILTYLKCRHKHKLEFIDQLSPWTLDDRLLVGTWGHEALKDLLQGGNEESAREAIAASVVDYLGTRNLSPEQADMAALALRCALIAAKRFLARFDPVEVEKQLTYKVDWLPPEMGEVQLTGTPDVIARDKQTNDLWLIDHKFRRVFRPGEAELLNLQMVHYTKLLQLVRGYDIVGSRQFQIKPIEPKTPDLTASGDVSRRHITTDWHTYSQAVEGYGFDIKDYLDMKGKLDRKVFFDLDSSKATRSKIELDNVWNTEIVPLVHDIVTARLNGGEKAYRCWDFSACHYCKMQDYCVGELRGEDLVYLQRTRFRKKGDKSGLLEILDDEVLDEETVQD